MAAPDSDLPLKGQRPLAANSSRPLPLGASNSSAHSAGNRPIPLSSRPDEVPQGYDRDDDEEEGDFQEMLRNAPAWLVSTVFHTLILIVLGVWAAAGRLAQGDVAIEVATEDPASLMGTQLEDPTVTQGNSPHVENPHDGEQVATPRDLAPVDDPLASPIEIGDLKLGLPTSFGDGTSGGGRSALSGPKTIGGAPIGLALKGRQIGSKNVLLGKYGGNITTEKGVELGLQWLAKQQKSDGLWSLSGPYSDGSRSENIAAATAMALLAFQGHGDTHRDGKYSKNVARAWNSLLKMQNKDGLFSGSMSESNQLLYTHAQCTIALCELYGMTMDSAYRGPAERAIAYCVDVQDKEYGGWRYEPHKDSDTSVTGWFVMALQSARMARLEVPEETLKNISRYLDSAQLDDGRRYGYWQKTSVTNAVSAEGLLCRQYLGWRQDDPRLVEGVSALNRSPIVYDGSTAHDVYYWYYATQATHHMEGQIWEDWNKVMREQVPEHQVKAGPEVGSWNPHADKWGSFGGRLYVTCLSIYMLEVYYRHLPIYSGYSAFENIPAAKKEKAAAPEDAGKESPETKQAPDGQGKPRAEAAEKPATEKAAGEKPSD